MGIKLVVASLVDGGNTKQQIFFDFFKNSKENSRLAEFKSLPGGCSFGFFSLFFWFLLLRVLDLATALCGKHLNVRLLSRRPEEEHRSSFTNGDMSSRGGHILLISKRLNWWRRSVAWESGCLKSEKQLLVQFFGLFLGALRCSSMLFTVLHCFLVLFAAKGR